MSQHPFYNNQDPDQQKQRKGEGVELIGKIGNVSHEFILEDKRLCLI